MREILKRLRRLNRATDERLRQLETVHKNRLQCGRGCNDCCVDDITVFTIEAENIREHHASLLAEGSPHPTGKCAFLDVEGACRIYDQRPYVCRTQGLPLRWIDKVDSGETVEYRDICPLNEEGPLVESLPIEQVWTLGSHEGALAGLQHELGSGKLERVPLRAMFSTPESESKSGS